MGGYFLNVRGKNCLPTMYSKFVDNTGTYTILAGTYFSVFLIVVHSSWN